MITSVAFLLIPIALPQFQMEEYITILMLQTKAEVPFILKTVTN